MSTNFLFLVEALQNQGLSENQSLALANQTDSACTEYADNEEIKIIAKEIIEDVKALEEALPDE